jgi:D-3-phosphoglycerate dehydrogenase / 2-oxoglutarate reductase
VAKLRILSPSAASFTVEGGGYADESKALEELDFEFFECDPTEDAFIKAAADADAIYAKGMLFTKRMIDALPAKCRGIVLGSVGVDQVDVAAATARGIPVTNCPDTFIEEVADHAMALLLAGHRHVMEQDQMVRTGRWGEGRPQLLQIPRLMGLTLGLVAFGHVARAVAMRAKPFGLHIKAFDPFIEELVAPLYGVEPVTLEEVLSTSDFVSMHAPATPQAQKMLTEKHFRQMKPTAWFINTGRGATVDEPALIRALQEGWIAGAALDVLAQEPPRQDNPLLQMTNVVLSPHNASASARFDPGRKMHVSRELLLLLTGRWPMSCVNPVVLAKSNLLRWQPYSMERGPNS